jgi:hypothetical protein
MRACLFPHPSGFVGIVSIVSNGLLIPSGNVSHQSGKPVQGVEDFPGLSVSGGINHFGNAVSRFFCRDIDHTFLGETSADNVPGKIAKTGLVIRIDSVTDIDMETGVAS